MKIVNVVIEVRDGKFKLGAGNEKVTFNVFNVVSPSRGWG